jgi:DNA-directed RNA polymerase subunit L
MRHVHVIATWQSEHVVELADEDALDDLVEVLQTQSNVKLVGYTAQPIQEAVDVAIDELLDR